MGSSAGKRSIAPAGFGSATASDGARGPTTGPLRPPDERRHSIGNATQRAGMPLPLSSVRNRLHRIEGQVRGIERMAVEGRDPIDVFTQVIAVRSALEAMALGLLTEYARDGASADELMAAVARLVGPVGSARRGREGRPHNG